MTQQQHTKLHLSMQLSSQQKQTACVGRLLLGSVKQEVVVRSKIAFILCLNKKKSKQKHQQ
jgi:hypothetical protein